MAAPTTVQQLHLHLHDLAAQAVQALGGPAVELNLAPPPNPEMGDLGFPVFPLAKPMRKAPPALAEEITRELQTRAAGDPYIAEVLAAGPYVNFRLNPAGLLRLILHEQRSERPFGSHQAEAPQRVMIEYSSPNTNKPQHLGHVRNNLLGHTVANILSFYGHDVIRANLINDRGIHICKSMLAYQRFGHGETPERAGVKGDHLVGDYYVKFNTEFDKEAEQYALKRFKDDLLQHVFAEEAGVFLAEPATLAAFKKLLAQRPDPALTQEAERLQGHFATLKALQDQEKAQLNALLKPIKDKAERQRLTEQPPQAILDLRHQAWTLRQEIAAFIVKHRTPEELDRLHTLWYLSRRMDKDAYFNSDDSDLGAAAREMLRQWEADDPEVRALWATMNGWVEAGFHQTYDRMGVRFDHIDHESETYLLGKDLVEEGLQRGVFHRAANGAVVFDLAKIGLSGEKAVLRPDGTSLYTTQDLGTAARRFDNHHLDRLMYVVGDEQDHHFKVLFGILGQLREGWQDRCHHLSYGMVLLPHGRMKSREGTVVDADDLLDLMERLAADEVRARYADLDEDEIQRRAVAIGHAALKFFLLNYSPPTSLTFDPEKSLEFTGETGPYLQYAYARTGSILAKAGLDPAADLEPDMDALAALTSPLEREIILHLAGWPAAVAWAASKYDPSKIAGFGYQTARLLARFFSDPDHNVLKSEEPLRSGRLALMWAVNRALGVALGLLGIQTLNEM